MHASRAEAGDSWRHADGKLRTAYALVTRANGETAGGEVDAQVQAQVAAFAKLLRNTAVSAPRQLRAELQAAAIAFNRANRSAIRAEHRAADALRQAGRTLLTAPTGKDGDFVAAALASAVFLLIALTEWHAQRGHEQQAAAAQQSLVHLRAARQQVARPALAQLAARAPSPQAQDRLAAAVRATIPEHAHRILADPAWPALATALAQAESAGTPTRRALADLSGQRELDTADRPAEILVWRLRNATAERVSQRVRSAATRSARSTHLPPDTGAPAVPVVQPQPADVNRRRPSR
ncbi:hypothetical protein [Streptomyces fungicidicus]|uniref:hypothetical protein n=1 Tax=Streptomyces fungicidicus TaxID=68203 RepID=UPI0036A77378